MTSGEARRCQPAAWHHHVVALLRDAMPETDGLEAGDRASRGRQLGLEVPVFQVVTRVGTLPNVRKALRDAQAGLPADRLPLAVIRDEAYAEEFVAMPLAQFMLLVSGWWAATQPLATSSTVKEALMGTDGDHRDGH